MVHVNFMTKQRGMNMENMMPIVTKHLTSVGLITCKRVEDTYHIKRLSFRHHLEKGKKSYLEKIESLNFYPTLQQYQNPDELQSTRLMWPQ